MSTYNEVLSQVQSLTSSEQLRLLEELAALVRRQVTSDEPHCNLQETQEIGLDFSFDSDQRDFRLFRPRHCDSFEILP